MTGSSDGWHSWSDCDWFSSLSVWLMWASGRSSWQGCWVPQQYWNPTQSHLHKSHTRRSQVKQPIHLDSDVWCGPARQRLRQRSRYRGRGHKRAWASVRWLSCRCCISRWRSLCYVMVYLILTTCLFMIKDSPKSAQLTNRSLPSNLRISARLLQRFRIPHRIAESWGYQGKNTNSRGCHICSESRSCDPSESEFRSELSSACCLLPRWCRPGETAHCGRLPP